MREITSAGANKMLKALEDEKAYLLSMEEEASVYVLAEEEQAEAPAYDYKEIQSKIDEIDKKVRVIKHALNCFNTTTVLDGIGITIDEALVEMAQLNRKKEKLDIMRKRLPKARRNESFYRSGNLIEYEYVNYDIQKVQEDYKIVSDRITDIQIALDLCNQTKSFVLPMEES